MSIRDERQKAVAEHQKFLADNTKDEQARYDKAMAQATTLEADNKALISQINDKKKEVNALTDKILALDSEIRLSTNELNEIKAKIDLSEKEFASKEAECNRKCQEYIKISKDRADEMAIERASLNDLKTRCDEAGRSAELKEASAKKAQDEANKVIEASNNKLAELKEATYEHVKTMAKYDQDRAKLRDEQAQVDKDREANKEALKVTNRERLIVSNREKECDERDRISKNKETTLELKEVTLNNRERRVNELIDIHNLKEQMK